MEIQLFVVLSDGKGNAVFLLPVTFIKRLTMEENQIEVLKQTELLGQQFNVYGTLEEPLFKAKDVTDMLGLTNPREVMSRIDDDERCKLNLPRQGETWMLTEDGLYEVLMQSRKPIAKQFKKGVKKILHEIRVKGGYIVSRENESDEDLMARALVVAKSTLRRRDERIKALETQTRNQQEALEVKDTQIAELNTTVSEMQDKVSYLDLIMQSKEHLTATQIGQDYGMSAVAFNRMLASFKVQRKVNNVWVVYAPYITEGYVTSNTIQRKHADGKPYFIQHTVWTQKGRAFLYQQLKKKGVLPTIERHS